MHCKGIPFHINVDVGSAYECIVAKATKCAATLIINKTKKQRKIFTASSSAAAIFAKTAIFLLSYICKIKAATGLNSIDRIGTR